MELKVNAEEKLLLAVIGIDEIGCTGMHRNPLSFVLRGDGVFQMIFRREVSLAHTEGDPFLWVQDFTLEPDGNWAQRYEHCSEERGCGYPCTTHSGETWQRVLEERAGAPLRQEVAAALADAPGAVWSRWGYTHLTGSFAAVPVQVGSELHARFLEQLSAVQAQVMGRFSACLGASRPASHALQSLRAALPAG